MNAGIAGKAGKLWTLVWALLRSRGWHEFAMKLLPIFSKREWYFLSAWLIHMSIRPLIPENSGPRVIAIEKMVFNSDLLAALGAATDINLMGLRRAVIKSLALGVLPREICADDHYIIDNPKTRAAKEKYNRVCFHVWRHLRRLGNYRAVLTANWSYWAERELGDVMERLGDPFIVMHKEGIKPPATSKFLQKYFRDTRGQFRGRRVLVYQELEREHQISGDISRAEQIVVCGMPRLDSLHSWRRRAAEQKSGFSDKPRILLLPFPAEYYLPVSRGFDDGLRWAEMSRGLLLAGMKSALQSPGCDFVVRPRPHEEPQILALLKDVWPGTLPANVAWEMQTDVQDELQAAWAVVGHNTTVLLEALAAGKNVIEPHFAEAEDPRYQGYIVDLCGASSRAHSVDELVELMTAAVRKRPSINEPLSPMAILALHTWTGNPDGRAGERVHAAVLAELQASTH